MPYRETQADSRSRYLETYDEGEAAKYDQWVVSIADEDHQATINDIEQVWPLTQDMVVLDVGAGTGALAMTLRRMGLSQITALEPSKNMSGLLLSKQELSEVAVVSSFCDHVDDRSLFPEASFDSIVSRLLVNCLYDPIAAFQNWHHWVRPGGAIVIIDSLFQRESWYGPWQEAVDHLPLSALQTSCTVPYLLEKSGFDVVHAGSMSELNRRPSTRTPKFLVVAKKP